MSVGAICFTSSGSNGGCWVVLVFPRPPPPPFFFFEKWVFFPHTRLTPKKKVSAICTKIFFSVEKKRDLRQRKKKLRDLHQKRMKKRLMLISTIELRSPPPPPAGTVAVVTTKENTTGRFGLSMVSVQLLTCYISLA